jgi:hypothetical protein
MAVILNPFAGRFVDDLQPLFEARAMLAGGSCPTSPALAAAKPSSLPHDKAVSSGLHSLPRPVNAVAKRIGGATPVPL